MGAPGTSLNVNGDLPNRTMYTFSFLDIDKLPIHLQTGCNETFGSTNWNAPSLMGGVGTSKTPVEGMPIIAQADGPKQLETGRYTNIPPKQGQHNSAADMIQEDLAQSAQDGGADPEFPYAFDGEHHSDMHLNEILPELLGTLAKPQKPFLQGGYANVYKGTWTRLDGKEVDVAIKVLRAITPTSITSSQENLEKKILIRMKRETLIWTRTTHRHIHPFLGYRFADEPQLISPWCARGNLSDYLALNQNLSPRDRLQLVRQAALGLAHLHDQKPPICHGDIKPENILINDSLEAALSDFGLSRIIEDIAVSTGLTTSDGGPKGTLVYTAPELLGSSQVTRASCECDVYAFGGLILTVMSGEPPFYKIARKMQIMMFIVRNELPKPADHRTLPETDPLWSLMRRCWQIQVSERPSMKEVILKLEEEIARREVSYN